jgi:CRISPR-associated protein Cmr4
MKTIPYLLYALSPLHAGTGQAAGVVDLPIARMRATGIPFVPGSSLKGVLREVRSPATTADRGALDRFTAVFGPLRAKQGPEGDTADALDHAGALIVGDARLLALPVRSFRGTFAFVTSPLLLRLAHRDLRGVSDLPEPPAAFDGPRALLAKGSLNATEGRPLYLEDLDLQVSKDDARATAWAGVIANALPSGEREIVTRRFAIVDDETMTFLWETATQIDTRIRVDHQTGTVADGALWTEESLPPETLLVGVLAAEPSRRKGTVLSEGEILAATLPEGPEGEILQLGGKATIGRGRCRIARWGGA